jgi:hypothetical protein
MSEDPVACAVAGPAEDGVAVLVSGPARAWVTGASGEIRLSGQSALTWTDRLVAGPVTSVVLRIDGGDPPDDVDPRLRLDGGVVPGGGLHYGLTSTDQIPATSVLAPVDRKPRDDDRKPRDGESTANHDRIVAEARPSASVPLASPSEPAQVQADLRASLLDLAVSEPFESVLLLQTPDEAGPSTPPPESTPPEPDARPLVEGADCKNGHFNDPRVRYCGICGIGMGQRTLIPRKGPRPPLGLLVFDDGSAVSLETDYMVGRYPENTPEVTAGKVRPLRVTDSQGSVSRRHAVIVLDQWDVAIVDVGSVNGTFVQAPQEPAGQQIPPNQPVAIRPGSVVRVGSNRTFRFESNRRF